MSVFGSPELQGYLNRRMRQTRDPYVPYELQSYHRFHRAINEFTWLLKAFYAPVEELKARRFRLDELFQRYIIANQISTEALSADLVTERPLAKAWQRGCAQALQKIWYNELAFHTPSLVDPFTLDSRGVSINVSASQLRLAFPSWRIVNAYYVVYHSYRALCEVLGAPYRPVEHESPLRAFKATKLALSIDVLFCFPFDLRYRNDLPRSQRLRSLLKQKPYLNYRYADHPRPPHYPFCSVLRRVVADFRGRWQRWSIGKQKQPYMIADLLHDFRNWVNYVDIDNVVALKGEGYRGFLDLDLSTIVYFHAGMTELAALAALGPEWLVEVANSFHERFVLKEASLMRSSVPRPLDSRMEIYAHLGRLGDIVWRPAPAPGLVRTSLLPNLPSTRAKMT